MLFICRPHILYQPGHGFSLQRRTSVADEPSIVHDLPPLSGIGSLHNLVRFWFDPPQVTGHLDQLVQSPQLPSILSSTSKIKGNGL